MMNSKEYYINNLEVLYEDNHLLVIKKPINVLCQKDISNDFDINDIVKEYLKRKYNKTGNVYLGLVHRLDRRVGGVLVLAKTSKAAARLSEDIKNHNVKKYYLAKTYGCITQDGSINIKIKKDEKKHLAIISNDGKEAVLNYQVINCNNNYSYVYVDLKTGRYNQIRVSFKSINHGIVNDYKYNKEICPNDNDLGLWCYKMVITHPTTKETMEFKCIPDGKIWIDLNIKNIK